MNGTTTVNSNVTMNGTSNVTTDSTITMDVTQLIIMFGNDNVTCTTDG